jgi:hypothetical protein
MERNKNKLNLIYICNPEEITACRILQGNHFEIGYFEDQKLYERIILNIACCN